MASQSGDNIFAIANSTAENATDDDVFVAPNADYHKWYSGAFDEDVYPLSHKRAEAILLKVTAGLSICGSLIIMAEVIKDHRMKRGKVLNRILLNLCIADLISSFAWFLSSWPTPQDDQGYYWRQVVYNVGNQATCTFQGFILEFGTMAALFIMVLLAWCYCLTLRYGWADEKLKPLEKYAYPIAWIPALVWALIPIPLDMYNNRYYVCKIEPYPIMCWETWTLLPGQTPDCTRGDNASLVRLYKMGIVWACILVVLVLFVMTICAVRKTERRAARWNHPVPEHEEQGTPPRQRRFSRFSSSSLPSSSGLAANSGRTTTTRRRSSQTAVSSPQPPAQNNRRYWRTKVIFKQCALYIIAYVITWVPMTINNYFIAIDFKGSWGTYFDTVASALVTMQVRSVSLAF